MAAEFYSAYICIHKWKHTNIFYVTTLIGYSFTSLQNHQHPLPPTSHTKLGRTQHICCNLPYIWNWGRAINVAAVITPFTKLVVFSHQVSPTILLTSNKLSDQKALFHMTYETIDASRMELFHTDYEILHCGSVTPLDVICR